MGTYGDSVPAISLGLIEGLIGGGEEFFEGFSVVRKNGSADGHTDGGSFSIGGEAFADSGSNLQGLGGSCLGKDDGELVAAEAHGGIHLAAMSAQHIG